MANNKLDSAPPADCTHLENSFEKILGPSGKLEGEELENIGRESMKDGEGIVNDDMFPIVCSSMESDSNSDMILSFNIHDDDDDNDNNDEENAG